jgi:hypothetical protein
VRPYLPPGGVHTTESILPRARRTGFYGGAGALSLLASALRFAPPQTPKNAPGSTPLFWRIIPDGGETLFWGTWPYRGGAMLPLSLAV